MMFSTPVAAQIVVRHRCPGMDASEQLAQRSSLRKKFSTSCRTSSVKVEGRIFKKTTTCAKVHCRWYDSRTHTITSAQPHTPVHPMM